MAINTIDALTLQKMFIAGAKNLEAKKEWINDLNVFPVPDGDTGTNMTMTIMSAVKEVASIEKPTMVALSKAISSGSLRGARGNSGVILSQLFRGFCKEIATMEIIDVAGLAAACQKAVETAYKAVMKPKEGTILTVAKGMAGKAAALAEKTTDLVEMIRIIIEEGNTVLQRTPELLPVLKEAGVVDSGGQGLMVVIQGAFDALTGVTTDFSVDVKPAALAAQKKEFVGSAIENVDIKFGYCTEFIVMLEKEFTDKDEAAFKAYLESIGDSIVCVADDELVKIHVHTNDPGLAIQKGLSYGSLTKMKIDNMREEHNERLFQKQEMEASLEGNKEDMDSTVSASPAKEAQPENVPGESVQNEGIERNSAAVQKDADTDGIVELDISEVVSQAAPEPEKAAAKEASQPAKTAVEEPAEQTVTGASTENSQQSMKNFGFVAVAAGKGIGEIFEGLGADAVIKGGQTMNPSTEDIMKAVEKVSAKVVFVLPNNKNIILAAQQTASLVEDKEVVVIPTATIPQGITALINFEMSKSRQDNEADMLASLETVKSGQLTYAVRDTTVDGIEIKCGDIMGIGDSGILAVGKEVNDTALDMLSKMMDEDAGLISIYYGEYISQEEAEQLKKMIEEKYPDVDVELSLGGQPVYYYILSVE